VLVATKSMGATWSVLGKGTFGLRAQRCILGAVAPIWKVSKGTREMVPAWRPAFLSTVFVGGFVGRVYFVGLVRWVWVSFWFVERLTR